MDDPDPQYAHQDLLSIYKQSQEKISELVDALREKEKQVSRLQTAYQRFEDLHFELEARSEASDIVMAKASQWYHENKMLKRQSTRLLSALQDQPDAWLTEEPAPTIEEEDVSTILTDMKERLSRATYSQLQAEKLAESLREKLKQVEKTLQEECFAHEITREKLEHQERLLNRLQRVSMIAVDEFQQIQVQLNEERSTAAKAKERIEEVKRERNVLARQSAILLANVGTDQKLMDAAMELERLTIIVEKQAKELEENAKTSDDWKSKWEKAGRELQWMSEECQKLQENDKINIERIFTLEKEVHNLQNQLDSKKSSAPPPPPPPPPPMPSTQWAWNPIGALMSAIGLSRPVTKKQTAVVLPDVRRQAMDDIMHKIERGEFRLRSIRSSLNNERSSTSDTNPAIEEMRNVLVSIKKGESMKNLDWAKERAPTQATFTGSLRLNSTKYAHFMANQNSTFKESTTLSPELDFILSKRRQAIENHRPQN